MGLSIQHAIDIQKQDSPVGLHDFNSRCVQFVVMMSRSGCQSSFGTVV